MSDVKVRPVPIEADINGDHDLFAHYVEKSEIVKALVEGIPVVALCGKIWVPSRDPENFPTCPRCKELYEALRAKS
jgi:hypothetical protein